MKKEDIVFQELDVGKIIAIPSDTEIPVYDNVNQTKRPLCANYPDNSTIIDRFETLESVLSAGQSEECSSDLFEGRQIQVIDNIEELQKLISEVLMRFDTDPKYYTKSDYRKLLSLLYKSLIYLYQEDVIIGPNLYKIISKTSGIIDLKYPVANPGDIIENEYETIPSVAYVNKCTLNWEEF